MTCQHCSAELPPFALFCGECGRSVSAPVVPVPVVPAPIVSEQDIPAPPEPAAPVAPEPAAPGAPEPVVPVPDEYAPVPSERAAPAMSALLAQDAAHEPAAPVQEPSFSVESVDRLPVLCAVCGARAESHDRFCAECGSPLPHDTQIIDRLTELGVVPIAQPLATPLADPRAETPVAPVIAAPAVSPEPDLESTRLVPRGTGGARFVLQFSTGESYTVLGSGLAGRNPHPEPGEYVDHLVTIVDPGRSVSKTHLEFGQRDGVFWVSDRHSGNGSVIREPGSEPRVCEPGKRYPIVRGTRVDLGEQFVVVS